MSSLGLLEDKSKEKKWEKILSPNQKLIFSFWEPTKNLKNLNF